jgi:hypothetical protein
MMRFRTFQLTQEVDNNYLEVESNVLTEEQPREHPVTPPIPNLPQYFMPTGQLQVRTIEQLVNNSSTYAVRTTEQLQNPASTGAGRTTEQLQSAANPGAVRGTEPLKVLVNSPSVTPTPKRIVRIPGGRKRKHASAKTEGLAKQLPALSPRLRHGIIFMAILLVVMTTLLYMTPLNSGHGRFSFFQGINDWIHAQQMNWQFLSHTAQTVQDNPAQNKSLPPPPSMTLPKSAYVAIAQQDAISAGISPVYFTRQINQESGFNPNAISPAGAEGIAQFLPSTASGLGINPWDPNAALNAAAHTMASYANTYGGDYAKALAAYNGGSGTVQYAINSCGAANWMNCLPGETRNYIRVIMGI